MKNRLFLIKEIYCLEKIKQAINDYKNLAVIELKEDENYYYCDFKETYYALDLTINDKLLLLFFYFNYSNNWNLYRFKVWNYSK